MGYFIAGLVVVIVIMGFIIKSQSSKISVARAQSAQFQANVEDLSLELKESQEGRAKIQESLVGIRDQVKSLREERADTSDHDKILGKIAEADGFEAFVFEKEG